MSTNNNIYIKETTNNHLANIQKLHLLCIVKIVSQDVKKLQILQIAINKRFQFIQKIICLNKKFYL